jgi:dienelactone hydrolase
MRRPCGVPGYLCAVVAAIIVGGLPAWAASQALSRGVEPGTGPKGTAVSVPWRAGNVESFQMGAVEEHRAKSAQGLLPVTLYRPQGAGPSPFVVLMHGCGGLTREATWTAWVQPWVDLFLEHGVGTAVVDSFGPRGVDQVCTTRNVAAWAIRRADDAYSARAWLVEQPGVDARRIAIMGMSNGGRTVLAALRTTLKHPDPFVAGVALYPGCQTDVDSHFYAPLLVLIGNADTVTPVRFCEQMKGAQPAAAPELKLIVYPRGPHTFDMRLPDRTVLGMKLGYDAQAHDDSRRQVIDFLTAHGVVSGKP